MNKTIGLKRGTVKLVLYSDEWNTAFEKEKSILSKALKGSFIDIQHIGSTSVPGLIAKPILDIVIAVPNIRTLGKCIKKLEQIGYQYLGDKENKENYLFVKGREDNRTHYVHIVEINSSNWDNYILFRDYLRNNKDYLMEYSKLKKDLAKRFPDNRKKYTKLKADFIEKTINKARENVKIELLINPFCLCERDFLVLDKLCKKHNLTFDAYNLWDIDDKDVNKLPKHMSGLIKEWRNGRRAGSVYSNVFINGERIPINDWPKSFDFIEKKIVKLLAKKQ